MDLKYSLEFLDDELCGLPQYYDYENYYDLNSNDAVNECLSSDYTMKMPTKVEDGGRGFFNSLKKDSQTKQITDVMKGTTTLGFVYQGGVIIAVDSRASMGNFMGSGNVKKVIEINEFLLGTMAGGAADCMFWLRRLNLWCKIYELRFSERVAISAAANFLCNMVSGYAGQGLSMGTMVTGWDKKGPQLYYVDDDGKCLNGKIFSAGSGSTYAFGVTDSKYKWDMSDSDAAKLGYEAVCHATYRDCGSGGFVRVYQIVPGGWTKLVAGDSVDEFHWKYMQAKGLVGDGDETHNEKLKV